MRYTVYFWICKIKRSMFYKFHRNYSGHLKDTKMWDNQLSLTEHIISILCLSICPSRFSLSQTDTQYVIFPLLPLSLIPYTVIHSLEIYSSLRLVLFKNSYLCPLSCAVDSDSPSSPHLKRGIRMVR